MKTKILKILVLLIGLIAILVLPNKIYASTVNNLASGGVSWGGTRVGYFEIDGRQAFCIDHSKTTPSSGMEYSEEVYNDANVRKILYYGWGGAGQWEGFDGDQAKGTVITTMMLNKYFHKTPNYTK